MGPVRKAVTNDPIRIRSAVVSPSESVSHLCQHQQTEWDSDYLPQPWGLPAHRDEQATNDREETISQMHKHGTATLGPNKRRAGVGVTENGHRQRHHAGEGSPLDETDGEKEAEGSGGELKCHTADPQQHHRPSEDLLAADSVGQDPGGQRSECGRKQVHAGNEGKACLGEAEGISHRRERGCDQLDTGLGDERAGVGHCSVERDLSGLHLAGLGHDEVLQSATSHRIAIGSN